MSKKTISKMLFSSEKVELSITDDTIKAMFKAIEKVFSNADNLVDEFENNKKRAQRQIQSVEKAFSKSSQIYNKAFDDLSRKAREVGIAPASIPNFEKMMRTQNFLDREKDDIVSRLKKYV